MFLLNYSQFTEQYILDSHILNIFSFCPPTLNFNFSSFISLSFCPSSILSLPHLSFCSLAILHLTLMQNFTFFSLFANFPFASHLVQLLFFPNVHPSLCYPVPFFPPLPSTFAGSFGQVKRQRLWPGSWQSRPRAFCVLAMCHPRCEPWPS